MKKTTVFILCIVLCFACQNKTRISYRGYGANETVGGSMHQLTIGEKNILVDCGIFYGDEGENYPLPEDLNIESIDAVLITHAHADHIGRIPLLLQNGYKGKIYTTEVSKDILIVSILSNLKYTDFGIESFYYSKNNTNSKKPVYLDRFSYGQYEVKPYNRVYIKAKRNDLDKMGFYLHKQTVKYLQQEIKQKLLQQLEAVDYGTSINMGDDIKATFYPTSHLPGAAMIYISALGKNILFTGDV